MVNNKAVTVVSEVYKALVIKHPGHEDQSVHGNRGGGGGKDAKSAKGPSRADVKTALDKLKSARAGSVIKLRVSPNETMRIKKDSEGSHEVAHHVDGSYAVGHISSGLNTHADVMDALEHNRQQAYKMGYDVPTKQIGTKKEKELTNHLSEYFEKEVQLVKTPSGYSITGSRDDEKFGSIKDGKVKLGKQTMPIDDFLKKMRSAGND